MSSKGGSDSNSQSQSSQTNNAQATQSVSTGGAQANVVSVSNLTGRAKADVAVYNQMDPTIVSNFLATFGGLAEGAAEVAQQMTTTLSKELADNRQAVASIATNATGSQTEAGQIVRSLVTPLLLVGGGLALVMIFTASSKK